MVEFGVRLTIVADGMEAEALCGLLRTAGVTCSHRQTDIAIGAWESWGTGGPREILVAGRDLETAREILSGTSPAAGA